MQRFNFLHFVGSSVGYMVLFIHQGPFIIYLFLRHQMLMPFSWWKSVDGWNVPSNKGSFSNLKLVIIMLVHVSSCSLRLFLSRQLSVYVCQGRRPLKQKLLILWFTLYVWPHVLLSTKSICFYNQKLFCKILPSLWPLHSHSDVTPTSMLYLKSKPVCVSSTHCQFLHPFCCDSIVFTALLPVHRPLLSRRSWAMLDPSPPSPRAAADSLR